MELLEVEHTQLRPDFSRLSEALDPARLPHGTTVLSFKFAEGVIVAGDRLATEGHRVASRDIQKVFPTDSHSLIAIAGAKIWVDNRVDFSNNGNLIVAAVTLVLGTGDFTLKFGGFALGGIGTATFGAILLHALLNRGDSAMRRPG